MPILQRPLHEVFSARISGSANEVLSAASDSPSLVQTLQRGPSDAAGGTDAPTTRLLARRSAADAMAVPTDSAASAWVYSRATAESAPAADTAARQASYTRVPGEVGPAGDSPSTAQALVRSTADPAGADDQADPQVLLARAVPDAGPAVDGASGYRIVPAAVVEHLPATTDTAVHHAALRRLHYERTFYFDTAGRVLRSVRTGTEHAPGTDLPGPPARRLPRTATEHAAAADSASPHASSPRTVVEALATAADHPARFARLGRAAADTAPATELPHRLVRAPRAGSEPAGPAADVPSATVLPFTPYGPPRVTSISASRSRVSRYGGLDSATVAFTFDRPVVAWSVRVCSTDHLDGWQVASWSGSAAGSGSAVVPADALREGDNPVAAYGRSPDGHWTP